MTDLYNQAIATHYSSYRPPLHRMILERVLADAQSFRSGLDVGCGTGYSAVALARYCLHVYGVEPSPAMLARAVPHEKITYLQGSGAETSLQDKSVDVVSFAGSLFYAKSAALIAELKRVCRHRALLIPYDFEILLDDVVQQHGISLQETASGYDHRVNFSDVAGCVELVAGSEQVSLAVSSIELAHLLLSSTRRYEAFVEKYGISDPYPALAGELEARGEQHGLRAKVYFAKYQLHTGY